MKKSKIFTLPNIISMVRIALIPIFVYFYFSNTENHYISALNILIVSGVSDVIDGYIARRFNMISDIGKVLDPIADKLTQGVVLFCLLFSHQYLLPMFIVLVIKELMQAFSATLILKSGRKPISSKWFGKLSTVMIYINMVYVIVADYFSAKYAFPVWLYIVLMTASIICMIISMFGYIKIFLNTDVANSEKK